MVKIFDNLLEKYAKVVIDDKLKNNQSNLEKYTDKYWTLSDEEIKIIRTDYKIIDVVKFDKSTVDAKISTDKYFELYPKKKEIIDIILDYHLSNTNKDIYEKTDYFCSKKEKLCVCNTNAHDLRKTLDGINYMPTDTYVSWIKKTNEPF